MPLRVGFAAFRPTQIGGCQLWLAANYLAGFADADAIGTWPDLSGNGRDATQNTFGLRPLYKTNIINGKPGVRFDGADDVMATTLVLPTVHTVCIVFMPSATTADARVIGGEDSSGGQHGLGVAVSGSGAAYRNAGVSGDIGDIGTITANVSELLVLRVGTAGTAAWQNGTAKGTSTGITSISTGDISFRIGGPGTGASPTYPGDLAEVIVYNSALDEAARRRVELYLSRKYSIFI